MAELEAVEKLANPSHEALNPAQKMLVRREYMRGTAALVLTRRVALVPYVLQAYRAALDPATQHPPDYLLEVYKPKALPAAARWRRG